MYYKPLVPNGISKTRNLGVGMPGSPEMPSMPQPVAPVPGLIGQPKRRKQYEEGASLPYFPGPPDGGVGLPRNPMSPDGRYGQGDTSPGFIEGQGGGGDTSPGFIDNGARNPAPPQPAVPAPVTPGIPKGGVGLPRNPMSKDGRYGPGDFEKGFYSGANDWSRRFGMKGPSL